MPVESLIEELRRHPNAEVVASLLKLGDPRANEAVLQALKKYGLEHPGFAIAEAIARSGPASGSIFLEALKDPESREIALWAIGIKLVDRDRELPADEAWQAGYRPVIEWLLDTVRNVQVRPSASPIGAVATRAVEAMAAIGDVSCIPTLEALKQRIMDIGVQRESADWGYARGHISSGDVVKHVETAIAQIRKRRP